MLEPEEVDEGYFTPVASTTLAHIFKSDSDKDEPVNTSLKYKPPQPKKAESSLKQEDPNASQCVFSCSLIAYEWLQGAHKCKGKVGFAVMKILNKNICKIILYSPDKSTLSCTTMSPQLEITSKGTMISLYDDHKKYWGLCFNDKNFHIVMELLQQENVIIKHYESPQLSNPMPVKSEVENEDTDEKNEADNGNVVQENASTLKNDKASILSRIANVGHAILPSMSASPVKKPTHEEKITTMETFDSIERLSVISDESETNSIIGVKDSCRSIGLQTSENNSLNIGVVPGNVEVDAQNPLSSRTMDSNQLFKYVNGCMVPVCMHVPVISNLTKECGISASEIGIIINRLTHLQGLVKTMEIFETIEKVNSQACPCQDKAHVEPNQDVDSIDSIVEEQNKQNLKKITVLEGYIREKDDAILKLQNEVKYEKIISNDFLKEYNTNTKCLEKQVENLKQDLINKDNELKHMIPKHEVDILIANTVKKLMNDTFRSLASNFESDISYSGSNVKGILANVIKKHTVESLSSLLTNRDASNVSTELTD